MEASSQMENDFLRDLQALKIKVAILKVFFILSNRLKKGKMTVRIQTYMSTLDQLSFAESKYFTVKDCQSLFIPPF